MSEKNQGPPEPPAPEATQPALNQRKEFSAASTGRPSLDAEQKFLEARLALVQSDLTLPDDQKEAAVRDLQRQIRSLKERPERNLD